MWSVEDSDQQHKVIAVFLLHETGGDAHELFRN